MSVVSLAVSENNPVTVDDLRATVGKIGDIDIREEEETDYLRFLQALYDSVQPLLDEEDYYPVPDRERFPRQNVHFPNPEDNQLGAWAWRYTLKDVKTDATKTGPLAGRTVCLKDCIAVADVPCLMGTDVVTDWVPKLDATVVTRLLEAGATIVGQAVCESMCTFAASFSAATGPVHNPYCRGRSAGGSSSGCSALVGAGLVDLAVGADQGGSIRMPAALCGCVGLKPTFGLVSYTGIVSNEPTNDHAGPITSNVLDNALMLQVIAGADNIDDRQGPGTPFPGSVPQYYSLLLASRIQGVKGMKIGLLREGLDMPAMDPRVRARVVETCMKFQALGAVVEEISIPIHNRGPAYHLAATRMAGYMGRIGATCSRRQLYLNDLQDKFLPWTQEKWDKLFPSASNLMLNGLYLWDKYPTLYGKSQNLLRKLRDAYDERLREYDIIVLPAVPAPANTLADANATPAAKLAKTVGQNLNCAMFNQTGHPALVMPIGMLPPAEGPADLKLPISLQIIGKHYDELTIYRAALALEDHLGDWKAL
ncbi:amidase signature enzyme [Punctularia strigosozonata HHB-11173 SS5]|uniref:Amidase signature enzyme n=1 Tax=Punctularia strigosozonata (strain HHB-11173) TaxID=741275 RepID=R7S2K9_PUNST|nr:amidase signature enzyme [Punctularia strigosozonata HHB-11173 SS5]EIN04448.1 amidase signature enzyme [Punctularia strigosozonata HHB-11173 SS5]